MRMNKLLCFILAGLQGVALAQSSMSLEEAWKRALEQNHTIRISKITTEIAANTVTKGNAGMLPTFNLQGGASFQRNNTDLDFAGSLPDVSRRGVQNYSYNGSVLANYRIYGGGNAWYNLMQLDNRYQTAVNLEGIAIEGTLLQVANAYFNLLLQQENVRIVTQSLATGRDRITLAQERQRLGTGTQLEKLNAQVNQVTDSISLLNANLALSAASRQLAFLLKMPMESLLVADTSLESESQINEWLSINPEGQATAVVATLLAMESAKLVESQNRAIRLPSLDATASYGYNKQINEVGVVLSSQNLGLNAGLTLSWNLFDGGRRRILLQNSMKQVEANAQLIDQARTQVRREWLDAVDRLKTQQSARNLLKTQIAAVQMNYQRTAELYRLGQVGSTVFREAQLNLMQVLQLQRQAQVGEKLAEIEIKRLAGRLLQNE